MRREPWHCGVAHLRTHTEHFKFFVSSSHRPCRWTTAAASRLRLLFGVRLASLLLEPRHCLFAFCANFWIPRRVGMRWYNTRRGCSQRAAHYYAPRKGRFMFALHAKNKSSLCISIYSLEDRANTFCIANKTLSSWFHSMRICFQMHNMKIPWLIK